jgi:transcriptional regulator with XRE-family HTH domain
VPDLVVHLGARSFALQLGELVRESRLLAGWTQRELAARASVSQSVVCRVETSRAEVLDLLVVERILAALGMRAQLDIEGRHLGDRRRQRDGVHARCNGYQAGRLERDGWLTATEVEVGKEAPRGWIDLLAYRPTDRALIVDETKTEIPDMGALQRQVAFYMREAIAVANRLGWRPTRVVALVVALDTAAIADRLRQNRDLVRRAFPSPVDRMSAWIADPSAPAPFGWTLATCDPASRRVSWLRPTTLGTRRLPVAYADYADAARRLGISADSPVRPRRTRGSWTSRPTAAG